MENTLTQEEIIKNKKRNVRIYPFYKMISLDFIFYYAISFLFMSDFKGFSASTILFADAFYPLFKMLFQIPCTILIEKIGKRNSLVLGNIFLCIDILLMIGCNSILVFILSNFFFALGYILKGTIEHNILYDSLPKTEKRSKIFSRVEGISSAVFYTIDSIGATLTGFLYIVNPYIPMILCLSFCILSTLISLQFKHISYVHLDGAETDDDTDAEETNMSPLESTIQYLKGLSTAFKYILRSRRLNSLILFNALFSSVILLLVNLRRSLLSDLGFSAIEFGFIFAILGIIATITSAKTNLLHKTLKNRVLTYFGIHYAFSIILLAISALLNFPRSISITIILLALGTQFAIKGPYTTLIKQYLNNFSHTSMRIKIHSANILIECITSTIFTLICSFLLEKISTAYVILIIGIISFILILLTLEYMKSRVGLKPEQYKYKDINYHELL